MAYSLYDAAVTPCVQQLSALAGIIDKAAAHCAANKIDEAALLQDLGVSSVDVRLFGYGAAQTLQGTPDNMHRFRDGVLSKLA